MLDALDVDKFIASHQSYAATLEAFDGKFREFRYLCVSSRGFEQKEHQKLSSRSIGSAHAF